MSDFDAPYDNYVRELEKARVSSSPNDVVKPSVDFKVHLPNGNTVNANNVKLPEFSDKDNFVTVKGQKIYIGTNKPYVWTGKQWEEKLNNLKKVEEYINNGYIDTCLSLEQIRKVFMYHVDKKDQS